ncbi:CHAP domain-containing protein, partial [bacterium]|nr:CHAP domain-containing protein [bacterium]
EDAYKMKGMTEQKNRKEINKITMESGVDCAVTPWCAAWAMNMLNDHGVLDTKSCPNVNSCPTVANGAKSQGLWRDAEKYTPQPGDAILFDWDGKRNHAMHIGIVVEVKDGKVITIEGNTSDSVNERQYALDSRKIMGYIECGAQKR